MKIDMHDYAGHVVAINAMARELQKQAAKPTNHKMIYKLSTDIMMECQQIRLHINQPPKTIFDYIKQIVFRINQ